MGRRFLHPLLPKGAGPPLGDGGLLAFQGLSHGDGLLNGGHGSPTRVQPERSMSDCTAKSTLGEATMIELERVEGGIATLQESIRIARLALADPSLLAKDKSYWHANIDL